MFSRRSGGFSCEYTGSILLASNIITSYVTEIVIFPVSTAQYRPVQPALRIVDVAKTNNTI